ncbi:MAG TPA: HAMP domain-containing sensor histidine kinase [Candidatus Saccharimonadales bacterium]|nr:HAMP domain-containing sensor histidine kinase [Candidatus Saccharimonadales bacterium]
MSLLAIITSGFIISISLLAILLYEQKRKSDKHVRKSDQDQKNYQFLVDITKDIQNSIEYGKDLENVVDVITKSLEKNFKYSTLSSAFVKDNKLVFKSNVKEHLARAFLDHVKDTMLQTLFADGREKPQITEEVITGEVLDNLINSSLMSTFDLKINFGTQLKAIINLASTTKDLYVGEDIKMMTTVADIASGFLTRLNTLVTHEKSKSIAMIDSFSEGIFMIDRENKLIAINNSALKFLNINKEFPTINDILASLPNTYNFKDKIEQVITQNMQITEEDVPFGTKIFKIILTPVLEINRIKGASQDNVIGASILLHDTTLEKSLSQMKEDFTNIMVHELRSPLTAIKASSDFLTSSADLTDQERKRLIEMISVASKKMLDEISLILDSAKMDAGLFTVRKIPSDLKKLIKDRVNVFTPVAQEKTIKLVVDIDPNINTFSFDPIRIDEVINNLLSNSLKFTPPNGTISINARVDSNKVSISVSDTGAGIPKDKQGKLFSKFQQAPSDGAHQGTGLGLYVVKGVVEGHGGEIKLESEEGHGTTITVTLPLSGAVQPLTSPLISPKSPNPMSN